MKILYNFFQYMLFYLMYSILFYQHGVMSGTNSDLQISIQIAYQRLSKCIRFVGSEYSIMPKDQDYLKTHYTSLIKETSRYRGRLPHRGGSFEGPWIENYFINSFVDKPFDFFGGIIPLFVQWSDYHLALKHNTSEAEMFSSLLKALRHDVIYVTVSQANLGLDILRPYPNVIVMSAGGEGNIAIPLLKEELAFVEPSDDFPTYDIGFYGSTNHGPRKRLLDEIQRHLQKVNVRVKIGAGPTWMKDMASTAFNLSPRGFGRASFRLAEIINIGRIPVYLYDDIPWVPYEGSNASVLAIGYAAQAGSFKKLVDMLSHVSKDEIAEKMARVASARHYYTYAGIVEQISLFFSDPLGSSGGLLRCAKIPTRMESVLDINL